MNDRFWSLQGAEMPEWMKQLAGILPLSALVDFINTAKAFHVFQLRGAVPVWCWPITPSRSRLLLQSPSSTNACWLDRYEAGPRPLCWDGRYGNEYPMVNAATIRLALDATRLTRLENHHPNIAMEEGKRPQTLELVYVWRNAQFKASKVPPRPGRTWVNGVGALTGFILNFRVSSKFLILHNLSALVGWRAWIALTAISIERSWWLALAFLLTVVVSGSLISMIHSNAPRNLGWRDPGGYERAIITAADPNATDWRLFLGESTMVNSLLNWTLSTDLRKVSTWLLLRVLIFLQWAVAIGVCAVQTWDAYVIAAWILICILAIDNVFCSEHAVYEWMRRCAGLEMARWTVTLSSRRALLNTIVALNESDMLEVKKLGPELSTQFGDAAIRWQENGDTMGFREDGLRWLDAILKPGQERSIWLEATACYLSLTSLSGAAYDNLRIKYGDQYWWKFVEEGTGIATVLRQRMRSRQGSPASANSVP